MNDQQSEARPAEATEPSKDAVTLVVDYGNGVQKRFAGVPWRHNMAVLDVIEAAGSIRPGLTFELAPSFTDRGGRAVGRLASIDAVAADQSDARWLIWINETFAGAELRQVIPGSFSHTGLPRVEAGDAIVLKLAAGP